MLQLFARPVFPTSFEQPFVCQLFWVSLPIVVVVSPLVSIMKDQVRDFSRRGLPSTYITSAISLEEELAILQGEFSLVYISPERLLARGKWREMLRSDIYREKMVGFVVDEAHCVKKW